MKRRAHILALVALAIGFIPLGLRAQQQPAKPNLPPGVEKPGQVVREEVLTVQNQLARISTKVNQLIQSQGGRFVFLISEGELIRLDTQTGKVAFFNIVAGATWDTLEIPERTLRPGNAFYEQYVQTLDRLDFNTN